MLKQNPRSKLVATVGALAAAVLLTTLAKPAEATLFIVDTKALDAGDLIPGDGKCEFATIVPVGQRCTLRAAIQEANALAGADIIIIPAGWHIVLSRPGINENASNTGDLDITGSVTIYSFASEGQRPVVDANGIDRVFDVHSGAWATISNLQIAGGATGSVGGGIKVNTEAKLSLSNCVVRGNTALGGGGVYLADAPGTFPLLSTISDCTFENNWARDSLSSNSLGGGAINVSNTGSLEITECTFNGNLDDNPHPAAIALFPMPGSIIRNSTISGNQGGVETGIGTDLLYNLTIVGNTGVGVRTGVGHLTVRNSIIANNSGPDCAFSSGGVHDVTGNKNLDSDGTCGLSLAAGDLPSTDPKLGILQLNGGTTRTMVPGVGSPVIDRGNNGTCETADQRGASRPLDGNETAGVDCDMGAVEVLPCVGTPFLVVTGGFISIPVIYTGCFTITAGPALDITATGDVTLRARDAVRFTNGFSVQAGGQLQVVRDPAAGSGITLP